ncbi:MAG: diguanylate cyclase [Microthrixaceae bacterium]
MEPDDRPRWKTADVAAIDDSVSNLIRQMVLAMAGMFAAFVASDWIARNWLDGLVGWSSFITRGVTFAVLGSLAIYLTSARPIRAALAAQQAAIEEHERFLREQSEQHVLASRLQGAFEMAETDQESFDVVAEALGAVCDGPAELLLADSSRAHLHRVAVSDAGPGCGVETPWSCPAVRRSRTMAFANSTDLDTCPRLRNRAGGDCSGLCVPVTVLGTPMGVLHTTGVANDPDIEANRAGMEALAEQAGQRIGVLRAMASSQLQATTDPLTGLLNRRSLEADLSVIRSGDHRFAVAFIDLDHFKELNDTFGHETGDRALRSFARVLRSTARETDLICRWGGEEFVIVFPDATSAQVEPIAQRIAGNLADAVLTGDVPPFTISVGLADSDSATEFSDVIRTADEAMFRAKQNGRDRIVRASSSLASVEPGATAVLR